MKSQGKFVMKSRIATIRHFASCESQARVIVNGATDECFRPKEMIGSAQTLVELVQVEANGRSLTLQQRALLREIEQRLMLVVYRSISSEELVGASSEWAAIREAAKRFIVEWDAENANAPMSDEAAFLEAIRQSPYDETVRLVYADWLDEQGDKRSEFLRVEARLRQIDSQDPSYPTTLNRWLQLRDEVSAEWVDTLGPRVSGLLLPSELIDVLEKKRWGCQEAQYARDESWSMYTYSHELMRINTENVCERLQWLGTPDAVHPPGDIDPRLAVMIGDEGMPADISYALDYRMSFRQPRVLEYSLYFESENVHGQRWTVFAPSFRSLWERVICVYAEGRGKETYVKGSESRATGHAEPGRSI
jgi:uncharacterized protein (TIGR02996 family)